MPGAECTSEPRFQPIRCELPSLAAGTSARLTVRATYPSASEVTFNAQVVSSNDVNSSNDQGFARVAVLGERDMRITAAAVPTSVTLGDPFDVEFDVAAIGNQTLDVVQVDVFMSFALWRRAAAASTAAAAHWCPIRKYSSAALSARSCPVPHGGCACN